MKHKKHKKKTPKTFVIFRVCYAAIDEPCESKKEMLEMVSLMKNALVYREEYQRNYEKGKWIGIRLLNKQHLSKYSKSV